MMKDYSDIIMVVGSDRVTDFDKILQKYNRVDFSFGTIQVVSAGERDPDAEGASGMSASKMRAAAKDVKTVDFMSGIPDTMSAEDKLELMAKVREGMGL
jgi:hypothetical protein